MKQTGSNLVTKAGMIILAGLLLAAAFFRVPSLMILLAALLLISGIAYAWTYFSLSKLCLDSPQPTAEGFPGEELTIHASLKNNKLLPVIWLRIALPVQVKAGHSDLPVQTKASDGVLQTFLWMMPYQTIGWDLTVRAAKRGVFSVPSLRVSGGDGFGLAQQERDLKMEKPFEMVVYPALIPVNTAPLVRCVQETEAAMQGMYEDRTLLRSTRPYQPADPVGRINWRQTARSGQVIVNVFEKQKMRHIALAPDPASFLYTQRVEQDGEWRNVLRLHEEAFEDMVSILASAAVSLLEQGMHVTLYLPQGRVAASDVDDAGGILYALALIEPLSQVWELPDETFFAGRHKDGPLFLFTKKADERIAVWLDTYRQVSAHVICYDEVRTADPDLWLMEQLRQ